MYIIAQVINSLIVSWYDASMIHQWIEHLALVQDVASLPFAGGGKFLGASHSYVAKLCSVEHKLVAGQHNVWRVTFISFLPHRNMYFTLLVLITTVLAILKLQFHLIGELLMPIVIKQSMRDL